MSNSSIINLAIGAIIIVLIVLIIICSLKETYVPTRIGVTVPTNPAYTKINLRSDRKTGIHRSWMNA